MSYSCTVMPDKRSCCIMSTEHTHIQTDRETDRQTHIQATANLPQWHQSWQRRQLWQQTERLSVCVNSDELCCLDHCNDIQHNTVSIVTALRLSSWFSDGLGSLFQHHEDIVLVAQNPQQVEDEASCCLPSHKLFFSRWFLVMQCKETRLWTSADCYFFSTNQVILYSEPLTFCDITPVKWSE